MKVKKLIDKLEAEKILTADEWNDIFFHRSREDMEYAEKKSHEITLERFGRVIYFRGIIEFTNICRKDCFYCGIRKSNIDADRYRLSRDEIMECCAEGYENGFRTFVLQGGEDPYFTRDMMTDIVRNISESYSDCAITLSIGELDRDYYQALYDAGARRYLLRHETADAEHYASLHPPDQQFENRIRCLKDLKEIGYQTGCGLMVGSPKQRPEHLAKDMAFIADFKPEMIGIGPFLPHRNTPFGEMKGGSVEETLFVIALCRIMLPDALIPATTALGTAEAEGRQRGVLSGCNVVMPNLSPLSVRKKYMLYDNKEGTDMSAAAGVETLRRQMEEIGYEVYIGRGDYGEKAYKGRS